MLIQKMQRQVKYKGRKKEKKRRRKRRTTERAVHKKPCDVTFMHPIKTNYRTTLGVVRALAFSVMEFSR